MTNPTAVDLIGRSNLLGADPKNTRGAGDDTSAEGVGTYPVTLPKKDRVDEALVDRSHTAVDCAGAAAHR